MPTTATGHQKTEAPLEKKITTEEMIAKAVQQKVTVNILNSIAKQGLLPKHLRKGSPCLRSGDEEVGGIGYLSVNELDLDSVPGASLTQKLKPLATEESAGIWPITLERNYKLSFPKDASMGLKPELEMRLAASVVLVFKKQPALKPSEGIKQGKYLSLKHENICFYEYRTFSPVPSKDLLAILGPLAMQGTIKEIFPTIPFIEVKPTKAKVIIPMIEVKKYWPSKFFTTMKSEMNVLDYVSGLESFVSTQKQTCFACHVVRLPTLKDVEYGLSHQLPHFQTVVKDIEANNAAKENEEKHQQEIAAAAITLQSHFKGKRTRGLYNQYKREHLEAAAALKAHRLESLEVSLKAMKQIRSKLGFFMQIVQP